MVMLAVAVAVALVLVMYSVTCLGIFLVAAAVVEVVQAQRADLTCATTYSWI
jgi:hypothetical protein